MFDISTPQKSDEKTLIDAFGRQITYLRVSVTDRCDLRCSYCMAENMQFLPRKNLLTYAELSTICDHFIRRGVKKIRLTGGEPLVRKDIMVLIKTLSKHLQSGALDELTLTTNATQLARYARQLVDAGVKRVNVSLDTRDKELFAELTRRDQLDTVLEGIDAGLDAGLKIKLNMVALKGLNEAEIPTMMQWAHEKDMSLTLIETMPMGEVDISRDAQYLPLSVVKDGLESQFTLTPNAKSTGGPARYYDVKETGGTLGMITPLTQNFCAGCNRVRLTCTGRIFMCLGQSDHVDLRQILREGTPEEFNDAINLAMHRKPEAHDFSIEKNQPNISVKRHMSTTGG